MKYNPGFLPDQALIDSFCVRLFELESLLETLRETKGNSNAHQLVIGSRGSGKTTLVLRVVAEVHRDPDLTAMFFPLVLPEEHYEVSTCGEFWLECVRSLAASAPPERGINLRLSYEDLRGVASDRELEDRCLATLLDFADRAGKRLLVIVENLNTLFADTSDPDLGWRLRKVLQTEPGIMLLATATCRFDEIDHYEHALYHFFGTRTLSGLRTRECAALWERVSGRATVGREIRSIKILTGGSPRLIATIAQFGGGISSGRLLDKLMRLVDDHTEYFKSHIEALPPQERRVYLALAEIWRPATASEVAKHARLQSSHCSAHLKRLAGRGVVVEAGGSPRRKEYYLAERFYNIYYLIRKRGGPAALVEALVRFMASFYSVSEPIGGSTPVVTEAEESCSGGSPPVAGASAIEAEAPSLAIESASRMDRRVTSDSARNRVRALWIRAEARYGSGDIGGCRSDIDDALVLLPESDAPLDLAINRLVLFGARLGGDQVLASIERSPSADLMLPLSTALAQELGRNPRVSKEVAEVARDLRDHIAKVRASLAKAAPAASATFYVEGMSESCEFAGSALVLSATLVAALVVFLAVSLAPAEGDGRGCV